MSEAAAGERGGAFQPKELSAIIKAYACEDVEKRSLFRRCQLCRCDPFSVAVAVEFWFEISAFSAISGPEAAILAQRECRSIKEVADIPRQSTQRLRLEKHPGGGARRHRSLRSRRRCNENRIVRVICQVHFASGLTPGRGPRIVSESGAEWEKKGIKRSITHQLYSQSNFIPPATRRGLSAESRLAFKCGKSAQSPPLTRNAPRLSSWCSLNKLNNEGISEMPERHYTPTISARSE